MSTIEWVLICGITGCVCGFIGLIIGCLMAASKDETIARDCAKCRQEMVNMFRRGFSAEDKEKKP